MCNKATACQTGNHHTAAQIWSQLMLKCSMKPELGTSSHSTLKPAEPCKAFWVLQPLCCGGRKGVQGRDMFWKSLSALVVVAMGSLGCRRGCLHTAASSTHSRAISAPAQLDSWIHGSLWLSGTGKVELQSRARRERTCTLGIQLDLQVLCKGNTHTFEFMLCLGHDLGPTEQSMDDKHGGDLLSGTKTFGTPSKAVS